MSHHILFYKARIYRFFMRVIRDSDFADLAGLLNFLNSRGSFKAEQTGKKTEVISVPFRTSPFLYTQSELTHEEFLIFSGEKPVVQAYFQMFGVSHPIPQGFLIGRQGVEQQRRNGGILASSYYQEPHTGFYSESLLVSFMESLKFADCCIPKSRVVIDVTELSSRKMFERRNYLGLFGINCSELTKILPNSLFLTDSAENYRFE